jgi:THO complex subunit 2
LTPQRATAVISTIKSLIGQFDLDPNRVFDIVLECFELQPENTTFLELIPLFPKSHTTHILGFKFQFYQRSEVEDPVPTGLYRLAATLIKANYIDLDSMYATNSLLQKNNLLQASVLLQLGSTILDFHSCS